MIRNILIFSVLFLCMSVYVHADLIDDFERYNYDAVFGQDTYRIAAVGSIGDKVEHVQVMTSPTARVIYIENKLQKILYLYRIDSNNAWMLSNKTKRPLKIALTQKVSSNASIVDLAGINIKKNFDIEEHLSDTELLLKSNSDKSVYPYISMAKLGEEYIFTHRDINKKPIKSVTHKLVTVSGKTFWMQEKIEDLVFKDIEIMYMEALTIKKITVPRSLFSFNSMDKLFIFFEKE